MFRFLVLLAAILAAVACPASEPVTAHCESGRIVLKMPAQGDGEWCLHVCKEGDKVTVCQIPSVDMVPGPSPGPDPDPTPDVLTERAKAIKATAEKATTDPNREQTALQLAELYRQIAAKVKDKSIVGQEMIAMGVKYGTDSLLTGKGSTVVKAWQPTRDAFSSQWAEILNRGGSDDDYVKLLIEVASGLQASAPNAEPQIDIAMIMQILKLIMELIAMFS